MNIFEVALQFVFPHEAVVAAPRAPGVHARELLCVQTMAGGRVTFKVGPALAFVSAVRSIATKQTCDKEVPPPSLVQAPFQIKRFKLEFTS